MASGRLGKCDLQSCCGTQVYQNLDPSECPVSLTYHAQALSTTVNVRLTTFVGIASTTLFATTDTFTWPHTVPMNCSFGGWISCTPRLKACTPLTNATALCDYWAKCGVVKSNTGFAVTQTSCYMNATCGCMNKIPAQGSAGLNIEAGFGTAVGDPGAIGARFPMPVEYTSGVGSTTRGQAYYSFLCQCIGMRCLRGDNPWRSASGPVDSGWKFGRTCDASFEGIQCRCCVPAPFGGNELVNPGIALTNPFGFCGCNTSDGVMPQSKVLGWIPGVIDGPHCRFGCCAMHGGIRVITQAHTGCSIENALQVMINPCLNCGQMNYTGCSESQGCKCPNGSHHYLLLCNSSRRSYNDNCFCGEAWDFIDWYSLTCENYYCTCCRCCPLGLPGGRRCENNGVRFDWSDSCGNWERAVANCGYACAQTMPNGACYSDAWNAPFLKWNGCCWLNGAVCICTCCNNYCCGLLKISTCGKSYFCCNCAGCRYYSSINWGDAYTMMCPNVNFGYFRNANNGCNCCDIMYCNDPSSPWTGTMCEGISNSRLTHGGGWNTNPNDVADTYIMSPYGVRSAASNGLGIVALPCGLCTRYWMSYMGRIEAFYDHSCTNCNCSMKFYYFHGQCAEQTDGVRGMAYIHDSEAAHGTLSACTTKYCTGFQEYPVKYFAYHPDLDCHYFLQRSMNGCYCGVFSVDWRIFRCMARKKCGCCCSSSGIICLCRDHIKSMKQYFPSGFIGIQSHTGCAGVCQLDLQYAIPTPQYFQRGGLASDNNVASNGTNGPGRQCVGVASVVLHKQAPFPAIMTARKYTTPRMCVSCLFRADYSLWSLSLYNCSTCGWDAFMSPDLYNWKAANFSNGNLATDCLITCFSTDCGCMYTVCDCFMANVDCSGVLDYCYEFNNYERTGVVLSYGDRLYVKNHSTTPFSFNVWGYEG